DRIDLVAVEKDPDLAAGEAEPGVGDDGAALGAGDADPAEPAQQVRNLSGGPAPVERAEAGQQAARARGVDRLHALTPVPAGAVPGVRIRTGPSRRTAAR